MLICQISDLHIKAPGELSYRTLASRAHPLRPFISANSPLERSVRRALSAFAKEQGVLAGILVGRLQFDGHIPFANLNGLKVKYTWNHDKP